MTDHHYSDATSVLLASLPVQRLNELAAEGRFEAPVSGDDLAAELNDAAWDINPGVCVSCGADTREVAGLSSCCGSSVAYPGLQLDDRRDR